MTLEKLAKKHQTEPIQYSIAHMHIISIICNCTQKKHDVRTPRVIGATWCR